MEIGYGAPLRVLYPLIGDDRKIRLTKVDFGWLEPMNYPRGGGLVRLAKGAVLDAQLRNASLYGAFNDHRLHGIRQALASLEYDEIEWLATAVQRAAQVARRREISALVRNDVNRDRDHHRQGRHGPHNDDCDSLLECPLCNPDGWSKYVYG